MSSCLVDQAIDCALAQDWKKAIRLNKKLITLYGETVETLNRLAYACLKSGNFVRAKKTYQKVLTLDRYNPIALKNLKIISNLSKDDIANDPTELPTPTIFLEESGKTKIVSLVNLAPATILCNLIIAQKVYLSVKKRTIEVRDNKGIYLGALPDDISHRLRPLILANCQYDVHIKNIAKNTVSVFIRELYKSKKCLHRPSFSNS